EGFVADPLPYYAAADLYCRSAALEGENLSSYQAMAAGLPVAGFDTGTATELLGKVGHGLLAANRDTGALALAAYQILTLPDRGRLLGARGAAYCREHLDIRRTITELELLYSELFPSSTQAALGR